MTRPTETQVTFEVSFVLNKGESVDELKKSIAKALADTNIFHTPLKLVRRETTYE